MKKFLVSMLTLCLTAAIFAQTAVAAAEIGRVNTPVRFRNEPNDSASSSFTIYEGYEVRVNSESNGWYEVEFDGRIGYIKTKYVDIDSSRSAAPAQSAPAAAPEQSSKPSSGTGYVTVAVRFREAPDQDAKSAFTLYPGTQVQVVSTTDGWCKVEFNGSTGYIKPDYLDIIATATQQTAPAVVEAPKAPEAPAAPSKPTSGIGYVNVAVRFREAAEQDAKSSFTLYPGAQLKVLSTSDGWCRVEYAGTIGFIKPDYLTIWAAEVSESAPATAAAAPAPQVEPDFRGTGTIRVAVRFRHEPADNSTSYQTLYPGYTCFVLSKQGDWALCEYAGRRGYIKSDYLNLKSEAISPLTEGTVINKGIIKSDGIYLRLGPANSYGTVRSLIKNESVDIYEKSGNWYRIVIGGKEGGFVHKDQLSIVGSKKSSPAPYTKVAPKSYASSSELGQAVVEEARKYLGTKYAYGEESPGKGFDCSGFVWYVFRQCGINTQRTAQSIYNNDGEAVSTDDLQVGDLVFFGSSTSKIGHVGIYIGDNQYIHASSTKKNVCISTIVGKDNFVAARRISG